MKSINRRLLALLLGGFLAIAVLAGVAVYYTARHELDEIFDYQLVQVALAFLRQGVTPLPSSISSEEEARLIVQVWKGRELMYSDPSGEHLLPRTAGFHTVYSEKGNWRVFVLRKSGKTIQVAQSTMARREISLAFTLHAVSPVLLAIPLFALFVWLSVRFGLSPLNRVADEVKSRSLSKLETISLDGIPSEVFPLVTQLNFFLERLSDAHEAQNRFVADAAHELRTPLAALALQLKVLERSDGEGERAASIDSLKNGINRVSHLVSQLLSLARLEPQTTRNYSEILVDEMARDIVAGRSRIAEQKGVDLGVIEGEPVAIIGEVESLRALIANLVDNAVRYTPPGGIVDVTIGRGVSGAVIEVTDTGPGIPSGERDAVFQRFYRCTGNGEAGSGLGLAIVRSALDRLGGNIVLAEGCDGKGLHVTVEVPFSPDRLLA
jgi:two-component system OmpR family sensor kinase